MSRDLERFVAAQEPVWDDVQAELAEGRKRTHWMWFIFPQIAGLGRSETARFYAIRDLGEARAYLDHPVLGQRLKTAARLMLRHRGRPAESVLGGIDATKLRSSMTLFERAEPGEPVFAAVLEAFFGGERCRPTLVHLSGTGAPEA